MHAIKVLPVPEVRRPAVAIVPAAAAALLCCVTVSVSLVLRPEARALHLRVICSSVRQEDVHMLLHQLQLYVQFTNLTKLKIFNYTVHYVLYKNNY